MAGEGRRIIKLFCPCAAKIAPFVAWEEQRVDLGSIARLFDLEPSSLKLNGHFISKGIDFIASSVTWKSLLSFFASRDFSTGTSDAEALIVHGKPLKIGTKRSHYSPTEENGDAWLSPNVGGENLFKRNRLLESKSSGLNDYESDKISESGEKRKGQFDDSITFKKIKTTETTGCSPGEGSFSRINSNSQSTCGMKRPRELDVNIDSSPCSQRSKFIE